MTSNEYSNVYIILLRKDNNDVQIDLWPPGIGELMPWTNDLVNVADGLGKRSW